MAPTRSLQINIVGDPSSFSRAMRKVGKDADDTGKRIHGFGTISSRGFSRVGVAASGMAGVAGGALGIFAKKVVTSASDINESLTKNQVLFGKYAKDIDAFSKTSAASFGISRQAALEYTGVFGNLFTALGVVPAQSAKMSVSLTKLAGDMASFNNTSIDDALEAIRSGLVGEVEPLRRFGVNLNDATLRQQAMSMGLTHTTKNVLTPYQRSMAAQALIVKQTAKAHGDFHRTQGGLANQTRILTARLSDAGAELGTKLIPYVLRGVKALNRFIGEMKDGTGAGGRFVRTLQNVYDNVRPVVRFFRDHPKLIAAAIAAWGLYKAAVIATVVAAKAQAFRKMFTGGGPMARAAGTANGLTFSSAYATSGAAGVRTASGKGGKLSRAFNSAGRGLGAGMGIAAAAMFAVELARGVESTLKDKLPGGDNSKPNRPTGTPGTGWNLFDFIKSKVGDGAGKAVDTMTSGIGAGGILPTGGAFGGSLHGARPAMRPFAVLGSRFGLQVTSGKDDHSRTTSSGNVSWHSTGEAIDMAGPATGMHAFASALRSKYGGRLAELISPWAGLDIKNGQPFNYGPAITAQHSGGNAHVHVAFDSGRPGVGDGIGYDGLMRLWTRAGGPANQANIAAAVALAESGGNPSIVNSIGATGLWQIHPAEPGSKDPLTNARQAVRKFRESGWQPWEAYTGPDGRGSDGPWRRFLRSGSSGGGGGSGSGGGSRPTVLRGTSRPGGIVGGGPTTGQAAAQTVADVDLAKATATAHDDLGGLIRALQSERSIKKRRAKHIRRYLRRKRITPANRRKFTEELTQLVGEIAELNTLLKEYKADAAGGATTITGADALTAGVADSAGGSDAEAAPTATDFANAAIAEAGLTPGLDDDIAATRGLLDIATGDLAAARASGDPRRISEAIGVWSSVNSSLQELLGVVNNEAETRQRLIDVTAELASEVKTQNEFSRSVAGIATREAVRALADVISGQIVGTNLQGRRLTAGNGVVAITP